MSAPAAIVDALRAVGAGDWEVAVEASRRAAARFPSSRLAAVLADSLSAMPAPGVYEEPSAFETFIGGGGNVALYRRTIEALGAVHAAVAPNSVLDVGCGDGRVTAGALGAVRRVDLVEPSLELLARAVAAVRRPGVSVHGHGVGIGEFLASLGPTSCWALTQATFSLHALAPDDRRSVVSELARRSSHLAIVEFDVPQLADRSDAHLRYLADRYERGIREHASEPEAVTGFLVPVLVGQLDPSRPRYTFEQPVASWCNELGEAGFDTETRPVSHYWWADAVLIVASSRRHA